MEKIVYNATQDKSKIYITLKKFKIINWEIQFYIHKEHIKQIIIDEFEDLKDFNI